MKITKNSLDTAPGPSDWFTGTVYIDSVATPSEPSRLAASSVHFTPGARTAWHTHPYGQNIYVTEGVGVCQRRGGPIEVIRPGDRVFFEPGEDHWHGAAATRWTGRRIRGEVVKRVGGPARARVITLFGAALALNGADTATVGAVAPQLEHGLHIGNTQIGLLTSVALLVGAVFTIPVGLY